MKNNINQSKQFFYPVRDAQDPYKVTLEPIPEHTDFKSGVTIDIEA